MKESTKKMLGVFSFIPLLAYFLWTIYFIVLSKNLQTPLHGLEITAITLFHHYDSLAILLSIICTLAAVLLVYDIVHLARVSDIPAGTKIGWIIFLVVFGAFAFPIFWYLEIRRENENTPMYASIE